MKKEDIIRQIKTEIEYQLKNIENINTNDIKTLLRNYHKYKKIVNMLEGKIKEIDDGAYSLSKKQNFGEVIGSSEFKSEFDKKLDLIEKLENRKLNYNKLILKLEKIFDMLLSDNYWYIIEMRYFENKSVSDIVDIKYISYATYNRHHRRLLLEIRSIFNLI